MKEGIFSILQRIGRSFMLPIALLPAAGLLLGLGNSLTNLTMVSLYHLEGILGQGTLLYSLLSIMNEAGEIIFDNLPLLFAMGLAVGMAKQEKAVAAIAAVISFLIMHTSISTMISLTGGLKLLAGAKASVCGITSLQMGVFGGIIVGGVVAWIHNRYNNVQLPQMLAFFGGSRFIPIVCSFVFIFVGILMFFIWPPIQVKINLLSGYIMQSGYWGTFVYGIIERALIPFGLHHVFYLPLWQTSLGGTLQVGGEIIEGAQNIFFAQLGEPSVTKFSVEATRFMSGKFPFMMFGLPGAALAMYQTSKSEKKGLVKGLLFSAALTSMLTGITEPIEFTFLFVAPFLYYIHCVLAGLSFMLMHIFNVAVGMTFSGGLIDFLLFGVLQGNAKTNWIWIVIVGAGYLVVYYFLFKFAILHWNLSTPGRGDDTEEIKLYSKEDLMAKQSGTGGKVVSEDSLSATICKGLGSKENIVSVDCCITKLRCSVVNPELVREDVLKSTGALGVICSGSGVQVVYGPEVVNIKTNLEEYLANASSEEIQIIPKKSALEVKMLRQNGPVLKGDAVLQFWPVGTGEPFVHIVKSSNGIHARPAAELVQLVESRDCQVTIRCKDKTASAKSIMELLQLGAVQGSELQVEAEGQEAGKVLAELQQFMRNRI